jgi:DnaJ-domain-containing protein 1
VVDYFALLEEPRRPWLDPDLLKQKFLSISAELHPDRVHGASADEKRNAQTRYTDLNTAYQVLREPRDRLAHLLELESGKKPSAIQNAPADLMEVFLEVGVICRDADKLADAKKAESSPLLQAGLFERGLLLSEKLSDLQHKVKERSAAAENSLRELDERWNPSVHDHGMVLRDLEYLYRTMSYLSRWSAQLQERFVRLAL